MTTARRATASARPRARRAVAALVLVLLAACAGPRAPGDVATEPAVARTRAVDAYASRLDETAKAQERAGHLADEATTLELLAILSPDDAALATRRRALDERIVAATRDRIRRGADAQKRGLLDVATNHYLAALALSPDDRVAADALRAIQKERDRRALAARARRFTPPAEPGD